MGVNRQISKHSFVDFIKNTPGKMKKILAVACAVTVAGSMIPLASLSTQGAQTPIYAVTTDRLNIRKGAGTKYGVIDTVDEDVTVTVLGRTNSNWLKVKLPDGTTGYCSGDYLDIVTDARVSVDLNLRKGAGTKYSVIKTLRPGIKLDIIKFCNKSWAQVELITGEKGYVCTDNSYVTYIADSNTKASSAAVKVSISNTSAALNIGKSLTLKATTNSGGKFTWSSSNKKVATVTSSGVVKGISAGTATVTAKDSKSGKTVKCTVKVSKTVLKSIKLTETSKTLAVGSSYTIKPSLNPSNGAVKYSTSNKSVASVTSAGVVKALKAGTAKITVADANGSKKAVLTVKVNDKLTMSKTSVNLDVEKTVTLKVAAASVGKIKWFSSNNTIATVSSNGVVKGVSEGTATITAKDSETGSSAKCTVKVKNVVITSIKLPEDSKALSVGSSFTVNPTITPSNGSVNYSTSNKSVATVTSVGVVKAVKAGTAKIKVADANGSKNAVMTVNVTKDEIPLKNNSKVSSTNITLGSSVKITGSATGGISPYTYSYYFKKDTDKNWVTKKLNTKDSSETFKPESAVLYNVKVVVKDSKGTVSEKIVDVNVKNKFTISETSASIGVGESLTLKATTTTGGSIKWSSSDSKVATVSSKGVVKGVSEGSAAITAKDSKTGESLKCTVKVSKVVLTSVKLPVSSLTLVKGESYTIKPTIVPENGKVKYSTSNKAVATVTSGGVVKAVKAGTANITVSDPNGSKKAVLKVSVENKPTIKISKTSASIEVGANVTLKATLSNGSSVKWSTSNSNVAAVRNGVVSGLKSGTATITAADETGKAKASCKITVKSVSSTGVSLSRYTAGTTAGKTIYIKGYSTYSASWGSSNTNIATVKDGFIKTKNTGKVAITYTDKKGRRAVCVVTVSSADPIKFTYSSPNSAVRNSKVKLIAITDKTRTKVKFVINVKGKNVTVNATNKKTDGDTYVWTAEYKATVAGTLDYKAYSYKDGKWSTSSDGKADIYVTTKTDVKTTTNDRLRASDGLIEFIGEKEGFVSQITYDKLANNIPTLGYGYVVWEGWTFYDNLTKNEAYALLVKAVNQEVYAKRVNDMLVENKIKFNQQQFDALVSFSYNLGTGWTYSSDLLDILRNSYAPSTSSGTVTATVDAYGGLYLRKSYTTSSDAITLMPDGSKVTLVSTKVYNGVWYKVKTSDGKVGYCSGTYLDLHYSNSSVRDLNYVNKNSLITEMLAYHHAGGVCYYGLLYRRADELEMFLYGDYVSDGRNNKHNFPNPYCISW